MYYLLPILHVDIEVKIIFCHESVLPHVLELLCIIANVLLKDDVT